MSFNEIALSATAVTEDERMKFARLETIGQLFDNESVGYKLMGHTGTFRLHMMGERCNLIWTRGRAWPAEFDGETLSFQIQTTSLFDLAMLCREMSDVIEQAIAEEIRRSHD